MVIQILPLAATTAAFALLSSASPVAAEPGPPPVEPVSIATASPPPSVFTTPEGWTLTAGAESETQVAVNPLTTALTSREYLVGATFTGSITGSGSGTLSGGTLEVGYQIGCGIAADKVKLSGSLGIGPTGAFGLVPTGVNFPMSGTIELTIKPGDVINVPLMKKEFKNARTRVTVHDSHIKIDGCVGQSFLRSYAVLTSRTDVTDDVVGYYGITKVV